MDAIEVLMKRRSVRKFTGEQITDEQLKTILDAGLYAPTGMGRQPWKFVVVQGDENHKTISDLNRKGRGGPEGADAYYYAPTIVLAFGDTESPLYDYDVALALGNMMNAAYAVGVGSCWIHGEKQMFELPEGKALMEKWGVPANFVGVGSIILGYADGEYPAPRERKENTVVYFK